jgi:glycosyltransferase
MITAVLNRADTIGRAINSVREQNYENIEHLIIDGASIDGTLAEVTRLHHSKIQFVSEPDRGIYDAINKGITLATGDVIGLMHSDDFFAHDRVLEMVASLFCDPDIDAVYGDLDYVSAKDTSRVVRHWRAGAFHPRKLRLGWMPPHPTLFVRREVVSRLGDYDTKYRIAADYDAILRWFGRGGIKSAYIPEVLVKMRVGGESNRSLEHIILKTREDYRALKENALGGFGTLILKNFGKIFQFKVK